MKKRLVAVILLIILILSYLLWQNNHLSITHYRLEVTDDALHGIRIVQLSDLHAKTFGEDQERLVDKVLNRDPDLIVLSGDMLDDKVEDTEDHLAFLENLADEVPVYAISGNHEYWTGEIDTVKSVYETLGIDFIDDESRTVNVGEATFTITGIRDRTDFPNGYAYLESLDDAEGEYFELLLAHRPIHFEGYAAKGYDLVLSGHAHGGMVRLPFIGGVYGPDQGFFPDYTTGPYRNGETTMVVSRGLGNSVMPFRIMNRPEIVVITLEAKA
ncbi:MAG: metallophosphoesterase [Bacillota bacterium]